MGYNINTLPAHILQSENLEKFYTESVLGGQTIDFLSDMGAVTEAPLNTTSAINLMKSTLVWQDGKVCKLEDLGDVALTQESIFVQPIAFKQAYCSLELQGKWASELVKAKKKSAMLDELMFGDAIVEDLTLLNKNEVEKVLWLGDKTLTSNLKFIDGFLKQLSSGTFDLSGVTGTDIVSKITNAYLAMPSAVTKADDFRIFIGTKEYKQYQAILASKNLFNQVDPLAVFGTSASFVVVDGLDETGKIVFARARNLQVKTDYEGADVNINIFYVENDDEMKARGRFGLGVKAIYKQEIGVLDLA